MADESTSTTLPENETVLATAVDVVSAMEDPLEHASAILNGLLHWSQASDQLEELDKHTIEEMAIVAHSQVNELKNLRDQLRQFHRARTPASEAEETDASEAEEDADAEGYQSDRKDDPWFSLAFNIESMINAIPPLLRTAYGKIMENPDNQDEIADALTVLGVGLDKATALHAKFHKGWDKISKPAGVADA